jgi:hypothetical protein
LQDIPQTEPYASSLNWLQPVSVPIAEGLPSGYYQLAVIFTDGSKKPLQFVIREDNPGSTSSVLVLDNATTRIAYNNWGGKSAYNNNSSNGDASPRLSLYRPGQNGIKRSQKNFLRWAQVANLSLEWASSIDWHNEPTLFENYETVVLVEHSEYWSREMRDQMDAHLAGGGNLLSMSGNTAWWQIRIEGDQMVVYKWGPDDPLYGLQDELVTTNFFADPVNLPENSTIGVSYRSGGLHNNSGYYMQEDGYGGYDVYNDSHPLFAGTGLINGDQLGQAAAIVGYEIDGAEFTMVDDIPIVTGADGTPPTLEILATAPAQTSQWEGTGTFVAGEVGTNGGQIINMATVYWADGLWNQNARIVPDPQVAKVTLNAFAQLSASSGAQCETGGCHPDYNDADGDGIDDKCDTCVITAGPVLDSDGDGTGDICEASY